MDKLVLLAQLGQRVQHLQCPAPRVLPALQVQPDLLGQQVPQVLLVLLV